MSVSDRRLSYGFLMHLTIGVVTCQNSLERVGRNRLQFTVNNERAFRTSKPFFEQKNALREFLEDQNLLVNLPTGFPASSVI